MKKLIALLMVLAFAFSAVACAGVTTEQVDQAQAAVESAVGQAAEAVKEEVAKVEEEAAPAEASNEIEKLARLIMVTGGESGTYFAFGGVIANVLTDKVNNLEITAVTSGASAANCRSLHNGEADLAIMQNDVLGYAVTGTETMAEDGAMPELRAIASMYPEAVQLVALATSGISKVEDLKGKKVCVGDQGSGSETNAKQVLTAYGLTYDDIDVQYLSFSEASTAMQNGTVDAAFATSALPNTAIVELSKMKDIVVVPIDGAGADALIAQYPFYAKTTIGADVYGVNEAGTVAMLATLVCTEGLDENVVYQIAKNLYEQKDALIAGHARGNDLDVNNAKAGVTVDFHPGALKYFAEAGVN